MTSLDSIEEESQIILKYLEEIEKHDKKEQLEKQKKKREREIETNIEIIQKKS